MKLRRQPIKIQICVEKICKQLSWKALRIVVTKKRPKMGRNLSPLLRQELANLDDDEEYLEGGGGGKARNKRECLVLRELSWKALRIVVTKKRPKTGRNLSPLLRQELANLDDDGDSRKSAMKTLKSYVIGLDSKATPQVLAQVSSAKFQGKFSNLRCSSTKQRKRGNETQKIAHENPDLRGKNLRRAWIPRQPHNLLLKFLLLNFREKFSNLNVLSNKTKEARNETQKTAHQNPDLRGKNLRRVCRRRRRRKSKKQKRVFSVERVKQAALMESPSNCGNKKEAKNGKKSESITAARIGKS
ncbi:PROTEIN SINE1 [Salix koriyanagi]|uniref:PROTEIN SINE1 n=1 Tax=Salix koriyanagi TaxID=2511006 RepID=A0A9Q1A627_9ROSI|nr:PROTEIN SINE1 [Salix koriyanagi]